LSVPGQKDRLKRCWICISRFPSLSCHFDPFPRTWCCFS
jgi:hypothetical protein